MQRSQPLPAGKRSENKAVLVLLGLTGAGKTTTLNFLFNRQDMLKTESYCSQTSTIMEYNGKVSISGDSYDLRIFDTPGFGDTKQKPQERDARFVATFDQLLKTHEILKSCYPTTVLLVAKFNDDRIDGETSHFIQMLKAIDSLLANWRLVDRSAQHPNLVFVLTHTMSEDNESLKRNPGPKIKLIESLVKTFTKIPTPIHVVMAENKPQDYNLPKKNDFFKLPNGQLYPLNLFNKMTNMAMQAGDLAGAKILHQAFTDPSKISVELQKEIKLFAAESPMARETLNILKSAKFGIENTQISEEIKKLWNKLDEPFKRPYCNALQITQATFHRFKIFGVNDLPTSKESVLRLLMDLPLNPPIIKVLEGLGISPPELPASLRIGSFYNIFADCTMTSSPFNLDTSGYTDIGFRAPHGVKADSISEMLLLTSSFPSISEYYKDRLSQLNISEDFKLENFNSEPKEGFNIIPQKAPGQAIIKLTGVKETRIFKIVMKNPTLSYGFRDAVRMLPDEFSINDAEKWQAFFNANGTHVVRSIYAGGCVEVVALKKQSQNFKKVTSPENALSVIKNILNNVGSFTPMDLDSIVEDWDFKINFRGGDQSLAQPNMTSIFTPQGVKFFKQWTFSLPAYPEMLHSEIGLECISECLRRTNPTAAKQIRMAITHLFLPRELSQPTIRHSRSSSSASSTSGDAPETERHKQPEPAPTQEIREQGGWIKWLKRKLKAN